MDTDDADVTHGAVARTNAIASEEQMPTATPTSLSSELQIGENLDISRQEDEEGVAAKIAVDSGRDRTESGNGTEKGFVGGIEEELTLPELRNAGLDQTTDVNEFKGNMQVEIPDSEMSEGMTCSPVKAVAERDVGISEAPVVDTCREAIHQIMYGNPHADSPDAVQKLLSGVEAERTKWEKKRQSLNLWDAEHAQEYFTEWYLWENKRLVKQKAETEGWAGVLTMVLQEKDLTDEHRSRDAVIALNVLLRRYGLGDSIDALEAASMTPTDEEQRNSLTSLARPDFAEFRKIWENRRGWSTPNLEPGELQRIVSTEEKTSGPHVDRDSQCLTTENHIEIQKGLPDSSSDHKHLDPSASLSNSIKDNNVEAVVGFSNKPPKADVGIPASETEGFVHTGNHQAENENAPSDIPCLEYTSSGNIQPSSYTRDFQEALILMASSPPYVETADPNGSLALPDNEKELRLADAEMQNMISQTTDAPAKQINSSPRSSDEQVHKPRTSSKPKSTNDTAITAIGTESTSIPDSDDVESSVKDVEMPEMTEDIAEDARGLVKSGPYLVSEKKDWPENQSCSSTPFIDKTFEDEVPAIATELPETSRRIITSPKKHPREGFLLTIGNHDRLEERPASLQAAPNDTTAMEADNCISSALATPSEPASSLANTELTHSATNKDAMTGVESVAPGISLSETNSTLTRIKPTATPIKFTKSPFSPQKPSSDVPAPLQPTTPSALFNAPPKAAGGQQNSQNQDVIMAELKAIKMTSIKARNEKLKEDIAAKKAKLEEVTNDLENPAKDIVARHIKLLHDYNDIRDVGQGLVGMIADNRGVRIGELYEEFGVGLKD